MPGYGQGVIIRDDRLGNNASVDSRGALRISGDVNASFSAASIAINDGGTPSQKATVFNTGAIRISGDVKLAGASTGDGAILDGVDNNVKATVYSTGAIRVTGDVTLVGGAASDGALVDGVSAAIRATVRNYANSKPLAVVVTNTSGDTYNAGGSGGDGAILDGVNNALKATVFSSGALEISGDTNSAQKGTWTVGISSQTNPFTNNVNVAVQSQPVTTVGLITVPIGISGDVSTKPLAGQTWPISVASTINVREQGVIGTQIVGGAVGGTVAISGDGIKLLDSAGTNKASIYSTGAIRISGDVKLAGASTGDGAILDGIDNNIKATVYTGGALRISGDTLLRGSSTGSYNTVTVTQTATQILGSNINRNEWLVVFESNSIGSNMYLGFNNSVTSGDSGNGFPIMANQVIGDDRYRGALWGISGGGNINVKYLEI